LRQNICVQRPGALFLAVNFPFGDRFTARNHL
jgi:hypothetical protein